MSHCRLCHILNEEFNDDGLDDGCCCCQVHKAHKGKWPPERA